MSSPEQAPINPEVSVEAPKAAERLDELAEKLRSGAELGGEKLESNEKKAERAKVEALENAVSVEKGGAEKDKKPATAAPVRKRGAIPKKEKDAAFKREMKQVQANMSAPSRAFSKFIHTKPVEKVSEVVGGTVARPNAILAGAIVAFVLVLAVYIVAKNFGYVLSGFETIAAFIVGWVVGTLFDYFRVLVTGKKS